MKKLIVALLIFLSSIPLLQANMEKGSIQSFVDTVWYCVYCGFMNDDKHAKCRNWDCPTNRPIE